jgi:hypothetical protein
MFGFEERRQRWEQDIRNRQRNIVFPDTLLNEARGFRNVLSGSTRLTVVHRFCLIVLGVPSCIGGAFVLRTEIDALRSLEGWLPTTIGIALGMLGGLVSLLSFYLGLRLVIRAVQPSPPAPTLEKPPRPQPVPGIIRRRFSQRPGHRPRRNSLG